MIHDAACPAHLAPSPTTVERHGVFRTSARWTPDGVAQLVQHLDTEGRRALAGLSPDRLREAWSKAVQRLMRPDSAESEALRPALARFSGLSEAGLDAALANVLGGVDRGAAAPLFAQAESMRQEGKIENGLVAIILAGNLPALAVQSLLPALALGRPVLLKSPSSEPLFAPAFVRLLTRLEPELEAAIAAIAWRGGDTLLEAPVLDRATTVLVYGDQETVDSVEARACGRCVKYGPRTSLALVDAESDLPTVAAGLVRDICLFDQRGCLSIQAVYTDGDAGALATALAAELEHRAREWPAGPLDPIAAAGVQQLRMEATTRGLHQPALPLATGTVVVEPLPVFQPSPGLRTIRVHPVARLADVPVSLEIWNGRLQGAALAGDRAWALESALAALGISRCAAPGSLQSPDALWHNGGVHPLEALGN